MAARSSAREALLETATRVLAGNPGASINEIATTAGVARATLYRLFSSREALIEALMQESLDATREATAHIEAEASGGLDALRRVFDAVVPMGARYQFLATCEMTDAARSTYDQHLERVAAWIDAAKSEGDVGAHVSTWWAVMAADYLIYAAWDAVERGVVARNEAPREAFELWRRGVAPLSHD